MVPSRARRSRTCGAPPPAAATGSSDRATSASTPTRPATVSWSTGRSPCAIRGLRSPAAEACRIGDPLTGVVMTMGPTSGRAQTGLTLTRRCRARSPFARRGGCQARSGRHVAGAALGRRVPDPLPEGTGGNVVAVGRAVRRCRSHGASPQLRPRSRAWGCRCPRGSRDGELAAAGSGGVLLRRPGLEDGWLVVNRR